MMDERSLQVLQMIKKDVEDDIREFEGSPFDGRTVSVLFGRQAAAIQALESIIEVMIKRERQ